MQRLFLFLYQYRALLLFLGLEALSFWLVVVYNRYQSAAYFNTANQVVGNVLQTRNDVVQYFNLKHVNRELAQENAMLLERLSNDKNRLSIPGQHVELDSAFLSQFNIFPAKVINNSTSRADNFITIDKGYEDGIQAGMGVITSKGVVGKVKAVSKHFATITSLLHTDSYVSSMLKKSSAFCTTKWDNRNSSEANLLYVPRHIKVSVGDTVVTSGFNSVFPENILIGVVKEVEIEGSNAFYDIKMELAADFTTLSYVMVVQNRMKTEIDSLELKTSQPRTK